MLQKNESERADASSLIQFNEKFETRKKILKLERENFL